MSSYFAAEGQRPPSYATTLAWALESVFRLRFVAGPFDAASVPAEARCALFPGDEGSLTVVVPARDPSAQGWAARGSLPRMHEPTIRRLVDVALRWTRERVEHLASMGACQDEAADIRLVEAIEELRETARAAMEDAKPVNAF